MLIRFFKENNLIGCGGDPQPIRLQVCAGVHVQGCMHRGVDIGVHTQGCTQRGVHAVECMQGCTRRGAHVEVCT